MEFQKVPGSFSSIFDAEHLQGLALVLLAFAVLVLLKQIRPRRWSGGRRRWPQLRRASASAAVVHPRAADVSDPAEQMHRIAKVGFETVPLMNREEFGVFTVLERVMAERRDGYRLMAQTTLGEIIRPKQGLGSNEDRDLAFRSINSKRLDFTIFDRAGRLALAIEYQGSGHYHEKSFMRDAVKREALRKAGVPMLEVPVRFDADELAGQVRRALSRQPSQPRPFDAQAIRTPDPGSSPAGGQPR